MVTKQQFVSEGKIWPISPDHGEVGCTLNRFSDDGDALWFKAPNGKTYGLNSFASVEDGFADITPIWLIDEAANAELQQLFSGQKLKEPRRISIGDLMKKAKEVCQISSKYRG